MNMKEAFRYQAFLSTLMAEATNALTKPDVALNTVRTHLMSKANPDAEDVVESAEAAEPQMDPDKILEFITQLITERGKLSRAVSKAKAALIESGTDIDADTEVNKFRQVAARSTQTMLQMKPSKRVERGISHKFNAEGVQNPYHYDIDVTTTERFTRASAKVIRLNLLADADKTSAGIDSTMITTQVDYEAPWGVNESFEDIFAAFVAKAEDGAASEAEPDNF